MKEQVEVAMLKYLARPAPEPALVLRIEPDLTPVDRQQLERMGFELREGFWVISRQKAVDYFKPFDYDAHWQWEKSREFK